VRGETNRAKLDRFMRELGDSVRSDGIQKNLIRYPGVDARTFRVAVTSFCDSAARGST